MYLSSCFKNDENAFWVMWYDIIWADNIDNNYSHETLINRCGIIPQMMTHRSSHIDNDYLSEQSRNL